jgi:hypothetical protein
VASTHQTLLVSGEETISADAKHYTDSVHVTDAGSIAMAHRVAEVLISWSEARQRRSGKGTNGETRSRNRPVETRSIGLRRDEQMVLLSASRDIHSRRRIHPCRVQATSTL